MDEDRTENHLPICEMPEDVEIKQADLCKAYIDVMRKMSDISANADPGRLPLFSADLSRTPPGLFFTRPIMVCASLLSIDSFAPVVIQERRKHPSVKRDVERRSHSWTLETGR